MSVEKDQSKGDHGYTKNPKLLQLNPKGLVPTLEIPSNLVQNVLESEIQKGSSVVSSLSMKASPLNQEGSDNYHMHVLTESIDCIEFLNALKCYSDKSSMNLIPDRSFVSAAHWMNQNICSTFYKVLMKPSNDERKDAFEIFAKSIEEFLSKVNENGFYQSDFLTAVDITVIPWIVRIPLLRHYRPMLQFEDYVNLETIRKLERYVERIHSLPSVKATLCSDYEKLIEAYARYADGTATSQVGQAVKSGLNAHDVK